LERRSRQVAARLEDYRLAAKTGYNWRFFRVGGLDQVRIDTGEDLKHLAELDPKHWVALSCPVKGL
jgi:hypothetical protein